MCSRQEACSITATKESYSASHTPCCATRGGLAGAKAGPADASPRPRPRSEGAAVAGPSERRSARPLREKLGSLNGPSTGPPPLAVRSASAISSLAAAAAVSCNAKMFAAAAACAAAAEGEEGSTRLGMIRRKRCASGMRSSTMNRQRRKCVAMVSIAKPSAQTQLRPPTFRPSSFTRARSASSVAMPRMKAKPSADWAQSSRYIWKVSRLMASATTSRSTSTDA
mmetsp:Transcript_28192/g.66175  ORF Transcript_28192/g.66175 Transcript_28192/m.66175 type:complete len:225 (-) Transcript_28192:214-888(-)